MVFLTSVQYTSHSISLPLIKSWIQRRNINFSLAQDVYYLFSHAESTPTIMHTSHRTETNSMYLIAGEISSQKSSFSSQFLIDLSEFSRVLFLCVSIWVLPQVQQGSFHGFSVLLQDRNSKYNITSTQKKLLHWHIQESNFRVWKYF